MRRARALGLIVGPEGSEIEAFEQLMARLEVEAVALADTFTWKRRPPRKRAGPALALLHQGPAGTAFLRWTRISHGLFRCGGGVGDGSSATNFAFRASIAVYVTPRFFPAEHPQLLALPPVRGTVGEGRVPLGPPPWRNIGHRAAWEANRPRGFSKRPPSSSPAATPDRIQRNGGASGFLSAKG